MIRFILALLVVLFSTTRGQISAAEEEFELPFEILKPSELEPGMKGYGLTVFSGVETERFDIEVKGVMKNAFADGDMIIVEAKHPIIEGHGVVAGMSGSPIFVDDKMIGALAYGWGFSVRGICGVTPVTSMKTVQPLITEEPNLPEEELPTNISYWPEAEKALSERGWEFSQDRDEIRVSKAELAKFGLDSLLEDEDYGSFQPLSMPLAVSSRSTRVQKLVQETFSPLGFQPYMAGTGAAGSDPDSGKYADKMPENGSAFSVLLCDGDLRMAGLGTATWVDGDRLVGFGHPMFGLGSVDAPIAISEVITVVPSLLRPFKLGNSLHQVGALREDRLPAVGATLNQRSKMIPLSISIDAEDLGRKRDFSFQLWNNRNYLPTLSLICFLEALDGTSRSSGPMGLDFAYTITLEDGREIKHQSYASGAGSVSMFTGFELMQDLGTLMNNRFEPVSVKTIDVKVVMESVMDMMILDEYQVDRTDLQAGDTFRAKATYMLWRKEPVEIPLELKLPKDLPDGRYEIHLMDGDSRTSLEYQLNPDLREIDSFDDLVEKRPVQHPNDQVYLLLVDPESQTVVRGQSLAQLPDSITKVMKASSREGTEFSETNAQILDEKSQKFDRMVVGNRKTSITVGEASDRPQQMMNTFFFRY